jgi:serine/threonine protein phosphatase PrpC
LPTTSGIIAHGVESLSFENPPDVLDSPLMLDGAFEPDLVEVDVAGGQAVAYTCRSPRKDTENEDTVAILPYGPASAVLVVADGAGGLPAGKRASMTAVNTLADSLQLAMSETMVLRTAILDGIEAANDAVLGLANGSATTMTVITLEGRLARSYQVGDSEAIVIGQRGLIKLQTRVHSPTGLAVEAGFLDEREALHHEDRHLVSNFIGNTDMGIDIGAAVDLDVKDTILLASDGLMDNVHVDEIVEIVRKGSLSKALHAVVELAQQRMRNTQKGQPSKPDDLSVILFRKPEEKKDIEINNV